MLHVIPLGGLGEFGLNALVLSCRGESLLIDCGLMFPNEGMPGVDIIVPDFTHLTRSGSLRGIVLTHGHEDHVGALPFLLAEVNVPVYGTRFTLALVRHRLEEMGIQADLRVIEPREPFGVGSLFTVEATRVTHTVPDAVGYAVRTPEGTVIHTGDFKLDPDPIDGLKTDLERWGEYGDEGVLCLLSDSTNSEHTQETGSERVVEATLERLFREAPGRVVLATFASNIHRLRHALSTCERLGRKVALAGRSMVRNVEMARELGYIATGPGLFIDMEEAARLPPKHVAVFTTGSQAEPRSGLVTLANGDGPVRLGPEDLVVLSSRPIPGNERGVGALIDQLYWRGCKVAYATLEPGVHVSGHASKPQQQRVLQAVRPQNFVPVHGELRMLVRHLGTARELGMAPEHLLLAKDGDLLEFSEGRGRFAGSVPYGRTLRDRFSRSEVTLDAIAERTRLAETGLLVAVIVVDRSRNALVAGPQVSGQGLGLDEQVLLPRVAEEAKRIFGELSTAMYGDDALLREELARAVKRAFKLYTAKRAPVVPLVVKI